MCNKGDDGVVPVVTKPLVGLRPLTIMYSVYYKGENPGVHVLITTFGGLRPLAVDLYYL